MRGYSARGTLVDAGFASSSARAEGRPQASSESSRIVLIQRPPSTKITTRARLLEDRLHHGGLEVPVELAAARLDQEDRDELLLRVDPEMGAESAVPAEAP